MKTPTVLAVLTAALSLGCAAATAPQAPPEQTSFRRATNATVEIGSVTQVQLERMLPPILARHGYFIIGRNQVGPGRYELLTDWHVTRLPAGEKFESGQLARTRLVVDVRQRGAAYGVAIYGVSVMADDAGGWRIVPASREMVRHVRTIGSDLALAMK